MFCRGQFHAPRCCQIELAGGPGNLQNHAGQPLATQAFERGAQGILFILHGQVNEQRRIKPHICQPGPIKGAGF